MTECPYCFTHAPHGPCCTSAELAAEVERLGEINRKLAEVAVEDEQEIERLQAERDEWIVRARQWERTANEERARADAAEAENKLLRIHRDTKEAIIEKLIAYADCLRVDKRP